MTIGTTLLWPNSKPPVSAHRGVARAGILSAVFLVQLVSFIAISLLPVSWAQAQSEPSPTHGDTEKLEGVYLILWGFLDTGKEFEAGEREKLQPLVDVLVKKNYKVYEDGPTFDQSKIDKAFEPAERSAHPKQISTNTSPSVR